MDDRRSQRRRRRILAIRFPDRRRGFPRRTPSTAVARHYNSLWLELRDRPTAIALLAALLLVLNLTDLTLTERALQAGAVEVNPIMAALFESGHAATVKVSIGALVAIELWLLRRYRPALVALVAACVGMGVLVTYQAVLVSAIS